MNPIVQFLLGDGFGKIIDRFFPDPAQKAQVQLEILKLQSSKDLQDATNQLQVQLAQLDIDKTEAQSTSNFRGGWRPAVGWICVVGLGYDFIVRPITSWIALLNHVVVPPQLDLSTLLPLLFGMLGLTAARSIEKLNGLP